MLRKQSTNGAIALGDRVTVSSQQISCDLDSESVVLHLEAGVYYGLNEVASRVWELLQESRTVLEIRDRLLVEYEIEESMCTQDLLDLLGQLHRCKLIELQHGNGSAPH